MNKITTTSTSNASPWNRQIPSLGISLMDHLFNKLAGAYQSTWKASFTSDQAVKNWRETWSEAFEEEGIAPDDIKNGLRNIRKMYVDWTPNLHQFLKACRPPIDPDAALEEALCQMPKRPMAEDKWSHPAIFWAAVKIGEFDLLSRSVKDLQPRFTRALKAVLDDPDGIKAVPKPAPRLPAPDAVLTKEVANAEFALMMAGLQKFKQKAAQTSGAGDGDGVVE